MTSPAILRSHIKNPPSSMSGPAKSPTVKSLKHLKIKNSNSDLSLLWQEIKDQGESIRARISYLEDNIATKIQSVEEKMVESCLQIKTDISALSERVSALEVCMEDVNKLKSEVLTLRTQIHDQQQMNIAKDAILVGIPSVPDENLHFVFNNLCHSLGCQPPVLRHIFRTKPKNKNTSDSIIILKFNTLHEKGFILKSMAKFRKSKGRQISLNDVGFNSPKPIHCHDCLTHQNRLILQHAIQLKRKQKIESAFISRGRIFIKCHNNDTALPIDSVETLNDIASSQQRMQHSSNTSDGTSSLASS